jgi:hypothetical protein
MKPVMVLCLFGSLAFGQTSPRSIKLGDVELTLGMSKSAVITSLSKEYSVENTGTHQSDDSELWLVKSKNSKEWIGDLSLRNDVLVKVNKRWDTVEWADPKFIQFIKSTYGATEGASRETKIGHVYYDVVRTPSETIHAIIFYFGDRRLALSLSEGSLGGKPYNEVWVQESIAQ